MIDRQQLALGGGVETGVVHINYEVTWTANQSGLVTVTFEWPFDLESGVRVMCDVGYLCANFSLPRPLCSRLRPNVHDRQTDVRCHRLMLPPIRGGSIINHGMTYVAIFCLALGTNALDQVQKQFTGHRLNAARQRLVVNVLGEQVDC